MNKYIPLLLALLLAAPVYAGEGAHVEREKAKKTAPPVKRENFQQYWKRRRAVAQQSAIVIVLCENGGKTPAARFNEGFGRVAIDPFVRPFYRSRYWLVGAEATKKNFFETIRRAAKSHRAVDILLFAHGQKKSTKLADGSFSPKDLVSELKGRGGKKIRMLFTTTCYSRHNFIKAWKEVGAWGIRGMTGVNRPLDFPVFFLNWLAGRDYSSCNQRGFRANIRYHKIYNRIHPKLKQNLRQARMALRQNKPKDKSSLQAWRVANSFVRLTYRWFRKPWKVKSSRPHISGDDARIDLLPSQRKEKK